MIALLIAVFPANIHVALQGHMPGTNISPSMLWWRLPFQPLLVAAVWVPALGAEPTDAAAGYAGVENPLFFLPNTRMLFGDAKGSLTKLVSEVKQL